MARYHVTVVSGDPSRTAAEAAADAGAEVIRKMSVPDGVAALAEVGEGDRYAEALRRLAGR